LEKGEPGGPLSAKDLRGAVWVQLEDCGPSACGGGAGEEPVVLAERRDSVYSPKASDTIRIANILPPQRHDVGEKNRKRGLLDRLSKKKGKER